KDRYDSFTLKQAGWKLDGRYLYIKNIGRFKLFLSRAISGTIKTVTIRRTSSGKWFVAFSCDDVPERKLPESIDEVGIDAGVKNLLVDTCGNFIDNPKNFRKSEKVLRRRQRALSRKKKSSYRRRKVRIIVAKTHEKIANQRKDFWHKKANSYIQNFGIIYIENLNIKGMVRNRHLSKSIADCSWGMFFNLLCYKAEEAGRIVIKVRPHGTSQKCSKCGKNVSKDLSVRVHHCSFCGIELDRDLNAAINILRFGQNLRALTQRTAASVARESP
ncbi:MAG: transposase, partial [Armatimonadota bacterium]